MIRRVLNFVRYLLVEAKSREPSPYRDGYVDALSEVQEYILDEMWEEGIDDDREDLEEV